MGAVGLTGYFGFDRGGASPGAGKRAGQRRGGAVGSVVGQIAKIKECHAPSGSRARVKCSR